MKVNLVLPDLLDLEVREDLMDKLDKLAPLVQQDQEVRLDHKVPKDLGERVAFQEGMVPQAVLEHVEKEENLAARDLQDLLDLLDNVVKEEKLDHKELGENQDLQVKLVDQVKEVNQVPLAGMDHLDRRYFIHDFSTIMTVMTLVIFVRITENGTHMGLL